MSKPLPEGEATRWFSPGTLWTRLRERTEHALKCGALLPIPTTYEVVEDSGIHFVVRVMDNLTRKAAARQGLQSRVAGDRENPFLPYDNELFVADVSATHLCLLNKYNVMDHHLLIVTRAFEAQTDLLNQDDFEALCRCLAEVDGLAFYNAGAAAGASQCHKHLQLVPLPLAPEGPAVPINPMMTAARPPFPFRHAAAPLDAVPWATSEVAAKALLTCYRELLQAAAPMLAYNLLVTRDWMLLVPRSKEYFGCISVNAMGFAGALLVRHREQVQQLKDAGPMNVLRHVATPLSTP
jgi:ATP adenylyltransferase